MSIEAVADFTKRLTEDASLQEELRAAVGDKEGMEASQAVADLGSKHGYSFTAEEAQQVRDYVVANESGELSEEQLEAVAGGGPIGRAIGAWVGDKLGDAVSSLFKKW
ncbi:MAG: Nif11-like leader peptide family RiPP precursor [Coleofasciculus sp. S288]|nr:Nif11-like leader peptide family RiPP precursor [Coleofasciculus sp. S288]